MRTGSAGDAAAIAVLFALGAGEIAVHARHLDTVDRTNELTLVLLLPLAVPVLFLGVSGGLPRRLPQGTMPRVLGRTLAWTTTLGIASLVAVARQRAAGVPITDEPAVVTLFVSLGSLVGVVNGVHAVHRSELRQRFRSETDRTERLNRQLSVLCRVLRHDLRNGLNVIHGYADMLATEESSSTADAEEYAQHIRDRADDLLTAGDRAWTLNRLVNERGAVAAQTTTDLGALVERQVESLLDRHPFVAVETDVTPGIHVRTVPPLDRAVWNVLENAVVHNSRDAPTVRIEVDADDDTAALTVIDDGPGIPEREVRVLERPETALQHSSGVGLWLVSWIVEESDGTVRVESAPDRGSAVTLRLPLASVDQGGDAGGERRAGSGDESNERSGDGRADDRDEGGARTPDSSPSGPTGDRETPKPIPGRADGERTPATVEAAARPDSAARRPAEEPADAVESGFVWTPTDPSERANEETVWDDLFESS